MTSARQLEEFYSNDSNSVPQHEIELTSDDLARWRQYRILEAQGPAGKLAVTYDLLYQRDIVRGEGLAVHEDIGLGDEISAVSAGQYGLSSTHYIR